MDRTREFFLLVETTGIPQRKKAAKEPGRAALVSKAEKEVEKIERKAQKASFVDKKEISRAEEALHQMYTHIESAEEKMKEIEQSIIASMRRKYSTLSLRLAAALRAIQKANSRTAVEQEARGMSQSKAKGSSGQMYYEKPKEIIKEEMSTLRKREMEAIETHINELGQMVTEVAMHIAIQGEQLERIDELFSNSKTSVKKGSFELNHALAAISKRRRTLIIVFSVLFFFLFLRLFLGRYS